MNMYVYLFLHLVNTDLPIFKHRLIIGYVKG